MGHILDEQRLLAVGILGHFTGMYELFVAPRGLGIHLLDIVDMLA